MCTEVDERNYISRSIMNVKVALIKLDMNEFVYLFIYLLLQHKTWIDHTLHVKRNLSLLQSDNIKLQTI